MSIPPTSRKHSAVADSSPPTESQDAVAAPGPSWRRRAILLGALAVLLVVLSATIGLRTEHYLATLAIAVFIIIGGRAYEFLRLYWPVPATGVVYDLSRRIALANTHIHVADLYHAELAWFGVGTAPHRQILSEYFATRTNAVVDLLCGFAYLIYLYVPMILAAVLFFVSKRHMAMVAWGFFVTNLVGIAVYLLYPAAPPWYVAKYGLGPVHLDAVPYAAGALRFDALLGINYFHDFYTRSSHVFGAMPSLHVGYTTAAALALIGLGWRWVLPVACLAAWVAFSAVYLRHHYVIDVIAGGLCATAAYVVVRKGVDRRLNEPAKTR